MKPASQRLLCLAGLCAAVGLSGCHHNNRTARYVPPPPANRSTTAHRAPAPAVHAPSIDLNAEAAQAPQGFFDNTSSKPVLTETGMASWYGTVYHKRAAADGTTFDQDAMTAAHRTLPLGTTVRVTNLATGQQVLVRITDRGPFAGSRIIDLSMGAAKAIGLYRMGVAEVKVEAYAHSTADPSGKWCVQTGAFKSEGVAMKLRDKLLRRYATARVIEFAGPTGYWVRIDPATHSKWQATEIASWVQVQRTDEEQPAALPYLVRID
jgi:rare lipoprotein A